MDAKLQGHLLLRQAVLDPHTKKVILGATSGNYEVRSISNSIRLAFRNGSVVIHYNTTHEQPFRRKNNLFCVYCKSCGHRKGFDCEKWMQKKYREDYFKDRKGSSLSYFSYPSDSESIFRALVETGSSNFIVGKATLDASI